MADAGTVGVWVNITPPVSLDFNSPKDNYGTQTIGSSPVAPRTLYVGTCYQGIWKSTDGGDHWTKVNTGTNGSNLDTGRNWSLAVDPTNPDVVYTVSGYGAGQGLWKSSNGGKDWAQVFSQSELQSYTADVYSVTIDPADHLHLLVAFHSGFNFMPDAGLAESKNGGQSWTWIAPQPWGAGHYAFFITSTTWLVTTQGAGLWRTTNSGTSWTKVSADSMQHGGNQLYRSKTGALYVGGLHQLQRSTDQGEHWSQVGPVTADGYNAVVGDGTVLYAQPANTGAAQQKNTYFTSAETDGLTWVAFNQQQFTDGPMAMVFDAQNRVVYSSNWGAGVWRLATGH